MEPDWTARRRLLSSVFSAERILLNAAPDIPLLSKRIRASILSAGRNRSTSDRTSYDGKKAAAFPLIPLTASLIILAVSLYIPSSLSTYLVVVSFTIKIRLLSMGKGQPNRFTLALSPAIPRTSL